MKWKNNIGYRNRLSTIGKEQLIFSWMFRQKQKLSGWKLGESRLEYLGSLDRMPI